MAVGVALALLATLCFAAGNALEKQGVDKLPPFSLRALPRVVTGLVTSGWWVAGAAISIAGLLAQILAYSHLAISIVQSIGVVGIVLLVAISRLSFGEHLQRRERVGLAVVVVALALVASSLSRSADAPGIHGSTTAFVVATAVTFAIVGGMIAAPPIRKDRTGAFYGCSAGLLYGLSGLGAKGLSTLIARAGWAGAGRYMFLTPFPYVFAGCWVLGLIVFQGGIQRCRVGIVGPLSTVTGSVFVVAIGTPVFDEHLPAAPALLVFRLVGFAGIVVGSAIVGWEGTPTPTATAAMAGLGRAK